jgi:septal ring factor EnvC (AmiA/AmiB activator)
MDPNTVRERLAKLHAELAAHQDNPAARQRLSEILPDVQRMVDQPPGAPQPIDRSLPDRLERVAVQFEADHPKLAASARSLIDLLSEVGI